MLLAAAEVVEVLLLLPEKSCKNESLATIVNMQTTAFTSLILLLSTHTHIDTNIQIERGITSKCVILEMDMVLSKNNVKNEHFSLSPLALSALLSCYSEYTQ